MSQKKNKVTLSNHRFLRIWQMDGNKYGVVYTTTKHGPLRCDGFQRGEHIYTMTLDRSGNLVAVRYLADSWEDYFSFREAPWLSPHSPF